MSLSFHPGDIPALPPPPWPPAPKGTKALGPSAGAAQGEELPEEERETEAGDRKGALKRVLAEWQLDSVKPQQTGLANSPCAAHVVSAGMPNSPCAAHAVSAGPTKQRM